MKGIVLAIAAMAFAPLALAGDETPPTMTELKQSIDALGVRLGRVENTLAGHTTTLGNLATAAAVTTLADEVEALSGRQQMAVIASVPTRDHAQGQYYLLGSSIEGFPSGPVADTGKAPGNGRFTGTTLPIGTYLFELQNPTYSDNLVCHGKTSRGFWAGGGQGRFRAACPRIWLRYTQSNDSTINERLDDGFGIYTSDGTASFWVMHRFPTGWDFAAKPIGSYTAAVKITKLK